MNVRWRDNPPLRVIPLHLPLAKIKRIKRELFHPIGSGLRHFSPPVTVYAWRSHPSKSLALALSDLWHQVLIYKLKKFLHPTYYILLKSYLINRYFQGHYGSADFDINSIRADVSQGGILSSVVYNIYILQTF